MESKLKSMLWKPNPYNMILMYIFIIYFFGFYDDALTFWSIFIIYTLLEISSRYHYKRNLKKFFDSIPLEVMNEIERDLEHSLGYNEERYLLIENYIILLEYPYKILKYEDILLIGYKKSFENQVGFQKHCYLVTKEKTYHVKVSGTFAEVDYDPKQFHDVIVRKNPNILVGLTKENKEKLKELYGIDMKKRPYKI